MAKKTVLIPVHRDTGEIPHWTSDQEDCIKRTAYWVTMRDIGHNLNSSPYSKEAWENLVKSGISRYNFEWKQPWEFSDTLKITGYGRGPSSAVFNLESTTKKMACSMFMKDLNEMLMTADISKGEISGRWIFCKRGQNYGIKYLGPMEHV